MRSSSAVARVIVTGGLLLCITTTADAGSAVRFGGEIGYGYTLLEYKEELDVWTTNGRFVLSGGGFAEFIFKNEMLRVVPGVRGARYGNKVDVNTGADPVLQQIGEYQVTLDYLAFPVLLKFKPARNAGLFLLAGPEFGVLVSTRLRAVIRQIDNQTDISIADDTDEDIKDKMKSYNFSGIVGLGQQRAIQGHVVSAQLRYNYGFVDVAKRGDWFSTWRTRAFEFVIGFAW